jgi:hypothetical protein
VTKPPRRPLTGVRPSPRARLLANLTGAGLWVSGGLWLVFHYFLRREGEWGPEPHALEPWWLRLHGAFAFLAVWTFGFLWAAHILGGWASGRRRWTGVLLAAWLLVMATSGYLLLYAGDDGAWGVLSPTHWIAGLALPAIYLAHRFLRRATA